jgi:hypothetical protein
MPIALEFTSPARSEAGPAELIHPSAWKEISRKLVEKEVRD